MSHLRQLIPSQVSRHSMSRNTPTPSDVPLNFFSQSPIGDDLTTKHPNHFRLLLRNPNGFSYENDLIAYQLCLHNIKSISTDTMFNPSPTAIADISLTTPNKSLLTAHIHITQTTNQAGHALSYFKKWSGDITRPSATHLLVGGLLPISVCAIIKFSPSFVATKYVKEPLSLLVLKPHSLNSGHYSNNKDMTIPIHENNSIPILTSFYQNSSVKTT